MTFRKISVSPIVIVLLVFLLSFDVQAFSYTANSPVIESFSDAKKYYIEVSISKCKLTLYEIDTEDNITPIREYDVGTVSPVVSAIPLGLGKVTRIDFKPTWYPTEYTREIYRAKGIELPKAVPPGHPSNYMGAFKIHLSHSTNHGYVYRIHGNNNKKRVGKRVTGGCICMDNDEGLELAKLITVGTEVNIEM
jgi:L,D-transpeptidase YnhG